MGPGEDVVGRRFEDSGTTYAIAGVARTPKLEKMSEAPRPAAWLSMRTQFISLTNVYVRVGQGDPRLLLPAIRETIG